MDVKVDLPFEGCKDCRFFEVKQNTFYSNGKAWMTEFICKNEALCRNAAEISTIQSERIDSPTKEVSKI